MNIFALPTANVGHVFLFTARLVAGRTVVFGADTGVCVRGNVILRHDVLADHWTTVSQFHVEVCHHSVPNDSDVSHR